MRRLVILCVLVVIVPLAGCRWFGEFLTTNINNSLDKPPKREPGMSDKRYERVLEEHRLSRTMREMQESENATHMKEYGYPKYPDVYCPPSDD